MAPYDFKDQLQIRPTEIKTYHQTTYDRISPSNTKFDAKGKTLFITAGATGIGYSISESFAKAGISRIIIIQRRQQVLDDAKKSLEAAYPNLKVETYAASQSDFPRMTEIIRSVGEIDVLVPCATAVSSMVATKDLSTEDMANYFNVNVVGLHHLVKEFLSLPSTAAGGPKSVLQVSSSASHMTVPHGNGYCASKAAANQIITHYAFDDPTSNVKFISFHPGAVWTSLAQENIPEDMAVWEDIKVPGDFAVWLASPEADFLNGRFVWAQWDVDDLISTKERVASDSSALTIGLVK
ncbi:hypothetical protein Q7P37_008989 [Cladosporium fusiforme]